MWHERIFLTSRITFGSGFILALFMTNTVFLMLLYGPYLLKAYPWWFIVVIVLIYCGFSLWLFIEQLIRGNLNQFNTDTISFDIWTFVHFMAGPFFALCLPFVWMTFIVVAWEIMEAYTYGFGESESIWNRIVDVVVALIGWWCVILVFKRTRTDIPWISARNAVGNDGKEIDWKAVFDKAFCGKCMCLNGGDGEEQEKQAAEHMDPEENATKSNEPEKDEEYQTTEIATV